MSEKLKGMKMQYVLPVLELLLKVVVPNNKEEKILVGLVQHGKA